MEHYCANFEPIDEKGQLMKDKQKLLEKMKKMNESWSELYRQADDLRIAMWELNKEFSKLKNFSKKIYNEEKLGFNVHRDCDYYNEDDDTCSNYGMSGAGFEVSRFNRCIDDLDK